MQLVRRKRFSRLCVLMNPILPVAWSIWTWPAKTLKNFSCGPDCSGRTQEVKQQIRQLTNRRIRTFMTAPSARNVNKTEDPP
jgi:hypothetical protein